MGGKSRLGQRPLQCPYRLGNSTRWERSAAHSAPATSSPQLQEHVNSCGNLEVTQGIPPASLLHQLHSPRSRLPTLPSVPWCVAQLGLSATRALTLVFPGPVIPQLPAVTA